MRRPTTAALVVAGALAGAVLMTGCGVSGAGSAYKSSGFSAENMSPAAAVKAATDLTAKSGSASVHLTLQADGGGDARTVEVRGVTALDGSAADITATLPTGGSAGAGATTISERLVDGVLYLRVEGSDVLPATWIKLDPKDLPKGIGDDLGGLVGGASSGTVTAPLDALREVADVVEVGPQAIDGIATTHYRATVDPARLAAALAPLKGMTGSKLPTAAMPVDLWVDAQGHVVRVTQTIELGRSGGSGGSVRWQLDLREFGAPVAVSAPAGALDLGSVLGTLGGLAGGGGKGLDGLSGLLDGLAGGDGKGLDGLSGLLEGLAGSTTS